MAKLVLARHRCLRKLGLASCFRPMEPLAHVFRGLLGIAAFIAIAYACSENRRAVPWRLVGMGLLFQFLCGVLVLKVDAVRDAVDWIGNMFVAILDFNKINRYHVSLLPYFLDKLKNTPEGDSNLLDKTMIMYGSPMADGNLHNHRRCPLILLGHGSGRLQGEMHLKAPDGTPMANVMLSLLHKLGCDDMKSFGDSTGEFALSV